MIQEECDNKLEMVLIYIFNKIMIMHIKKYKKKYKTIDIRMKSKSPFQTFKPGRLQGINVHQVDPQLKINKKTEINKFIYMAIALLGLVCFLYFVILEFF